MIYTVSARDKEKRSDIEKKDFTDRAAALKFYNYLYGKYGESERYAVKIDMGFGEGKQEGEQGNDSELSSGNLGKRIGN